MQAPLAVQQEIQARWHDAEQKDLSAIWNDQSTPQEEQNV
jgi:hypothetical protein